MNYQANIQYAREQDNNDSLYNFRDEFHFPNTNGKQKIYLCGNSLGLQPKLAEIFIGEVMADWKNMAVDGHFYAKNNWVEYHEKLKKPMANVVGALPEEIAVMNTLTVNLHLLLVSFYRPTKDRFKIIMEKDAFPSDKYVVESQLKFHGYNPDESIILIEPDENEIMSENHILDIIQNHGSQTALILLGGINYYTGQLLNIKAITEQGHKNGCVVGFDLAHAAGNVLLQLHDHDVDFAAWCTYKYMNSGPGNLGAFFINKKHHANSDLPRFTGWWGHKLSTRFNMRLPFDAEDGAEGWVLGNPPVFGLAAILASLTLFEHAGISNLREKSIRLTGYLEFLLKELKSERVNIITPNDPRKRGAQLSVQIKGAAKTVFEKISNRGVITDWREPDVIRVSPAPLYNSFEDVYNFSQIFSDCI